LLATRTTTKLLGLPPGLRARRQSSGTTYFYLKTDLTPKELPLGKNRETALDSWRTYKLKSCLNGDLPSSVFTLLEIFRLAEIPIRVPKSRPTLLRQVASLEDFFRLSGNPTLIDSWPDAEAYYRFRGSRFEIRAGAELRLLIHVWRWAQKLSLVTNEHVCPWTSDTVKVHIRQNVLRELADALLAIAPKIGLLSHYDTSARDHFATNAHSHERASSSAGIAVGFGFSTSTNQIQSNGPNSHNGIKSSTLLRDAAEQLTKDGRRDLAREVRRLSSAELEEVLTLVCESTESMPGDARLLLGMGQSTQLAAVKRTYRNESQSSCPPHSNDVKIDSLTKTAEKC
jgi:hypothetical protein